MKISDFIIILLVVFVIGYGVGGLIGTAIFNPKCPICEQYEVCEECICEP